MQKKLKKSIYEKKYIETMYSKKSSSLNLL